MKYILPFILCGLLYFGASASTNITTPTVAGHWTAAGSPYKIFNDVVVPIGATLEVDPGVEIIFHGFFLLKIDGILQSVGSATNPIRYYVNDTTGKYQSNNVKGGWAGFYFNAASGSVMEYCHVADMKPTYDSGWGFTVHNTPLKISKCKFFHNALNVNWGVPSHTLMGMMRFFYSSVEMDGCEIYENNSQSHTIQLFSCPSARIQNCDIHHNRSWGVPGLGASISVEGSITFTGNSVHDEICSDGTFTSRTTPPGKVVLNKNQFYRNKNKENAAVNCNGGSPLIENNIICNNSDDSAWCGFTSGGGGVHLFTNGPEDTSRMIIRNNIIANNYSAFHGGGIYIYKCNAVVINNQIVNNKSKSRGAAVAASIGQNTRNSIVIKNNVLHGNYNPYMFGPHDIWVYAQKKCEVEYSHNLANRDFSTNLWLEPKDSILYTDTSENIISTNPGLVLPTVNPDTSENALYADFRLLSTSLCINAGAASIYAGNTDYSDCFRTAGGVIDIGAYEYGSSPAGSELIQPLRSSSLDIYPNPANGVAYVTTRTATGKLELIDAVGKVLSGKSVTERTTTIDLHSFPSGTYFIRWTSDDTEPIIGKLLVK